MAKRTDLKIPYGRRLAEDFANTTPIRGSIDGEIRLQGYMQNVELH